MIRPQSDVWPSSVAVMSSPEPSGLGASLVRAFVDLGIAAQLIPQPLPRLRASGRLVLELGATAPHAMTSDARALEALERVQPDLVVVVKGSFVSRRLVERMRQSSVVVCWNPDSPFDSAASNRGGRVFEAVDAYNLYVTWSHSIGHCLSDLGVEVTIIPFGFDPHVHFPVVGSGEARDRIVFAGTASPERIAVMNRLGAMSPLIYGNGWPAGDYEVRRATYGSVLAGVLSEARWCINLLRPQNRDSHNMRSFELPACGGRQLTMATDDHVALLPGTGAVLVDSIRELIEAAGSTPEPERIGIGSDHNYAARVSRLLAQLQSSGHVW